MLPLRYFRAAISNPASLQIVAGLAIDSLAEDGDVDGGGSEDALPVQLAPQHQVLRPGLNRHGEVILVILATGLTQPEPDVPARLPDDPVNNRGSCTYNIHKNKKHFWTLHHRSQIHTTSIGGMIPYACF